MPRQTSPLENLERKSFMSRARRMLLDRMGGGGGYMGGPTGGQFGMMSGTQPAAGESQAFNERNKNRAELGTRFGAMRGKGLEREKISSSERIRAMMEAGATGRTERTEKGLMNRFDKGNQTIQREQDFRYAPGDAFGPPGVDRYKAETDRMNPKMVQPREPKVYSSQIDPMTGQPTEEHFTVGPNGYKVPVGMPPERQMGQAPIPTDRPKGKQKPLTVEEQKQWEAYRQRYGLK